MYIPRETWVQRHAETERGRELKRLRQTETGRSTYKERQRRGEVDR